MEMTLLTREQLKLAYDRDLSVSFPRDELKPFRAKERMLDRGSYSIVEAAYSCGFVDPESFQYHFRNIYHMTPEEYLWEKSHK